MSTCPRDILCAMIRPPWWLLHQSWYLSLPADSNLNNARYQVCSLFGSGTLCYLANTDGIEHMWISWFTQMNTRILVVWKTSNNFYLFTNSVINAKCNHWFSWLFNCWAKQQSSNAFVTFCNTVILIGTLEKPASVINWTHHIRKYPLWIPTVNREPCEFSIFSSPPARYQISQPLLDMLLHTLQSLLLVLAGVQPPWGQEIGFDQLFLSTMGSKRRG